MSGEMHDPNGEVRGCEDCGGRSTLVWRSAPFAYLDGDKQVELVASIPVWKCANCGDQYTDSQAEDIRHESVCHYLGRLTPSDIKTFREVYQLTQGRLGEVTGYGVASIRRWETGNQIQSLSADRSLRLLFSSPEVFRIALRIEGRSDGGVRGDPKFVTPFSPQVRREAEVFQLRAPAVQKAA